jgi:hypothetical protein
MPLEHSLARQPLGTASQASALAQSQEITLAEDLLLGAGPIASFIYGKDDDKARRDIYRNPFGFSFFRHGAQIAALKSTIIEEIRAAERAAQEKRQQSKEAEAQIAKRRRRNRQQSTR